MSSLPKLVLHFDVNETIMLADPAAGNTFEETLNMVVSKVAFVHKDGARWYGGTVYGKQVPSQLPPIYTAFENLDDFSSYNWYNKDGKKGAKRFTEKGEPGEIFREYYDRMERALRVNGPIDKRLCHDGKHYFLIPAFFRTISELARSGRSFAIVIRTFGSDVGDVVAALQAYTEGELHAALDAQNNESRNKQSSTSSSLNQELFSDVPQLELRHPPVQEVAINTTWTGQYDRDTSVFTITSTSSSSSSSRAAGAATGAVAGKSNSTTGEESSSINTSTSSSSSSSSSTTSATCDSQPFIITDEQHVVDILQGGADRNSITATACTDDYSYWNCSGYKPECGKPLWITQHDPHFHHIFFDDNIHNNPADSIVAVRESKYQGGKDGSRRNNGAGAGTGAGAGAGEVGAEVAFESVSGERTVELQGVHLVRVPTILPILDHDWFLKQITRCEAARKAKAIYTAESKGEEAKPQEGI